MNSSQQIIYSVSEINSLVQQRLESGFHALRIRGEISNFTAHSSGHWYFTLKDSHSQLKAVMFRSANQQMDWKPSRKDSLEVIVYGYLSVYKPRGEYQITCQSMEKSGKGALREEFERLKVKLEQEGLFKQKRPLPFLPQHIGIISSPTGAALQDILNILNRRYKGVQKTLIPALMQGLSAPQSLIQAIEQAKKISDLSVLILARGGGSIEDLSAFNDEALARAIFKCPWPVISAIGHETDFTISDFVADLRAPTPSAGAEIVTQNVADLNDKLKWFHKQLIQSAKAKNYYLHDKLLSLSKKLIHPEKKIQELQQYLDDLISQFKKSATQQHKRQSEKLAGLLSLLESLSPLKVLSRGYCLVRQKTGQAVTQAKDLHLKQNVDLVFASSMAEAKVLKIKEKI